LVDKTLFFRHDPFSVFQGDSAKGADVPHWRTVMNNKGLLVGGLSLVAMLFVTILMYVSYSNSEVRLRNEAEAQQEKLEVVFDATWKIIQQKAGVSSQYAKDFKEIYPELMEGRYNNDRGGALMSWITEHNPEFDTEWLRFGYESLTTPQSTYRHHMETGERVLLKRKEVPGYRPEDYEAERVYARILGCPEAGGTISRQVHPIAGALQRLAERPAHALLVVHDENSLARHVRTPWVSTAMGSRTRNTVPCPT